MSRLNNKQNKSINPIISRQDYHLTQPCPSEEKRTKTPQISPYTKLTQTTRPTLGGQKPKGRKNSTLKPGKGDLKHNKLKKKMKRQRNITHTKEQTRNTEAQINEEEIGKLPEK